MERQSSHLLRLAGIIVGLTLLVSLVVLIIGLVNGWNRPVQFSNGFFVAGIIVIVLGTFSVAGGFQQRANFPLIYAETASQASIPERAQRLMADVNQRYGTMVMLIGSGLLLIVIAVLIHRLF